MLAVNLPLRSSKSAACATLLATLCGSCLQLRFERDTRLEPVPKAGLAALTPGTATLEDTFKQLGPPLYAWELPDQGFALAWGWYSSGHWQFKVSVPTPQRAASPYLDYANDADQTRGAVLFFDAEGMLSNVREGLIRDLRDETRVRPEDTEAD